MSTEPLTDTQRQALADIHAARRTLADAAQAADQAFFDANLRRNPDDAAGVFADTVTFSKAMGEAARAFVAAVDDAMAKVAAE